MLRIFAKWFGWSASSSFDESVSLLMKSASIIAHRFCHEYVGTEHLLLALLDDAPNHATELLCRCGVEPGSVAHSLEHLLIIGPPLSWRTRWHQAVPTPRLLKVLEFARAEAASVPAGDGTAALLIGLAQDRGGIAGEVLRCLNVGEAVLRANATEMSASASRRDNK